MNMSVKHIKKFGRIHIKIILVFGYLWKGRERIEYGVKVKEIFDFTYNILF